MASVVSLEGNTQNPFEEIKSRLFSEFDSLIDKLEKRRTELLDELERMRLEWTKRMDKHKQSLDKLITMKKGIEDLCVKDNDISQIHEASLKPILENIALLQVKIVYPNIKFETHDIHTVSELVCVLGDIQNIPISLPVAKKIPIRKIVSDSPSTASLIAYKNRNEPVLTINKSGKEYGDLTDIKGISFNQQSQQIYITSGDKHKIFCFKIDGTFCCIMGEDILKKPCGVYSCLDYCFVTDQFLNKVLKFDIHNCLLVKLKVTKKTSSKDQFNNPTGIAGDINENSIFVFDSGNNRICILPFDLTCVTDVIQLKHDSYVSTEIQLFNELLFLLGKGEDTTNCIHAYSRKGEKLYSLVPKICFSDVGSPQSFSLDTFGNFIISESIESALKVFSNGGEFSCRIGNKKGAIPRCICIANNQVVCAFSDGNIYIY